MWGIIWRATIVVAVIAEAGSTSAFAADGSYVPKPPTGSGIDGSTAQSLCIGQAPTIDYSIVRVGGGSAAEARRADARAELVFSGDGKQLVVPLATASDGTGEGSVLWPGVTVDSAGTVTALPGWVRSGDEWQPRDDAAAWTTDDITAQLRVGDERLDVPLAYPGYSDECATPAGVASSQTPGGLAMTGGQMPVVAAVGGTAAVVAGVLLVARRRRRVES